MHCSANRGVNGETALFFGLSGTGKTTLSADPDRHLIGDDEHGWSDAGIFNFEGGCYAKCIHLSKEREPQIWSAIRRGAVLENVVLDKESKVPDYDDDSITENTRAAYPLDFIDNAVLPSVGGHPKNIFFLTADAFGVLPPIARLNAEQAMYRFLSGYTSKIAGTESSLGKEPQSTGFYSALSGARYPALKTLVAVSTISRPTDTACAIRSSMLKACVLPPALSRPDARWLLARGSNAPECTGPFTAPTPSLLFAARNSVVVFRTSGNAGPHDSSLSRRAPIPTQGSTNRSSGFALENYSHTYCNKVRA
jgi:hypothetical protein